MRHRSPARWLAPLALVTCAVAVYAVVQHGSSSDGKETPSSTSAPKHGDSSAAGRRTRGQRARTYTVKPGDVLSAIAEKNGLSVEDLQRSNPGVDASALHPGQRLRLPR